MPRPDYAITVRPITELTELVLSTMDCRAVRVDEVKEEPGKMIVTLTIHGGKIDTPRGE